MSNILFFLGEKCVLKSQDLKVNGQRVFLIYIYIIQLNLYLDPTCQITRLKSWISLHVWKGQPNLILNLEQSVTEVILCFILVMSYPWTYKRKKRTQDSSVYYLKFASPYRSICKALKVMNDSRAGTIKIFGHKSIFCGCLSGMIFHWFPFLDQVNPALVNFVAGTYELSMISNIRLRLNGGIFHWLKNLTRHVVHGTVKYFFLSYVIKTKKFEDSGC